MPTVVDAYNVLHVTGVLSPDLAGIDLAELASLIATSRYRRDEAMLVCDGVATPAAAKVREPAVRVAFAGGGKTADEYIARVVNTSTAPRRLTVVSSDRAVLKIARRRGCETVSSERFLAQLEADRGSFRDKSGPRKPDPDGLSRESTERWIAAFGIDERLRSIPAATPKPKTAAGSDRPAAAPAPVSRREEPPAAPALPADVGRILDGLDLERMLAGTPPPRDSDRTPRPTRASRDRARKRRGRRRDDR